MINSLLSLLHTVRSAVRTLLPFEQMGKYDQFNGHLAEFVCSSVLIPAAAGDYIPFAGGRHALAATVAYCPPCIDASPMAKVFPQSLSFRKKMPGLHSATPDSTGKGTAAKEHLNSPLVSMPSGSQKLQPQKPPMNAERIAKLRQYTLEDFDDYAEKLGDEPLSDIAKACSWKLALRILDEFPDYYYISPEAKGSVSICTSKRKHHYFTILCKADGSVSFFVTLEGNTILKRYASIDGLPDNYMRQALAPLPEAGYPLSHG